MFHGACYKYYVSVGFLFSNSFLYKDIVSDGAE